MPDPSTHRPVHPVVLRIGRRHPADLSGFATRRWLSANRASGHHYRELLARFAIASVEYDVLRIGIDADQASYFAVDPGFFPCLANGRLRCRLAKVDGPAW